MNIGINKNKTTALNISSTMLVQLILFITAPVFLRIMSTEQYGMYAIYNTWLGVFNAFMGFKLGGCVGLGKYKFEDSYNSFRGSILFLGTIISIATVLVCSIFIKLLTIAIGLPSGIVFLMMGVSICTYVFEYAQNAFIFEKKPEYNLTISVFISLVSALLAIFLIYRVDENQQYVARAIGYAVPYFIVALVIWFAFSFRQNIRFNREYLKFALVTSIPLMLNSVAGTLFSASDRIMMQHMNIYISEIGIYNAFHSFAIILTTILTALRVSFLPFYFDDIKENNTESMQSSTNRFTELFTVLVCGFLLLSREVGTVFAGDKYVSGLRVIPVFVLGIYAEFLSNYPNNYEVFYKRTDIVVKGTVISGLANIILNFYTIPRWGIYGAAASSVVAGFVLAFYHYLNVKKMEQGYPLRFVSLLPWLVTVIIVALLYYVLEDYWYIRWSIGALIGFSEIVRLFKRKTVF